MNPTDLCLFALNASRDFGEAVAQHLGITLSPHEEREFEDGEHKSRPLVNVRRQDIFVVQSLYADGEQSVNDKLCRLLFFIGALKDASAASVTAIVPYLGYARKDQKSKPRDPVTTRYVAGLFEAVGTDRVVTLDVHNLAAFQNAYRCRTEHLQANGLFVDHFVPLLRGRDVVVVAPDAGGIKRADRFRQRLSAALHHPVAAAFAEKHRSDSMVRGDLMVGDVQGRTAIIVDDMIGSGTTIARTVTACRARGAVSVHAATTHGLFVGDAPRILADEGLDSIVVTDSVPPFRLGQGKARDKLAVLGSAPLFGDAIASIQAGGSIVKLLES
jgi:ribose-phosphate pyrophosphokinase